MRALEEQVILITGATDGLGKATALELAKRGARVLIVGRDHPRIAASVEELSQASNNPKLRGYYGDFSSLASVRQLASELLDREPQLDVLVNNAGVGVNIPGAGQRQVSQDGLEQRFQVNYLAPFLLTHTLLPLLQRSAPARIVNVASIGQRPIDFDNVMLEHNYSGEQAYCQSKLALIMFTFDLSQQLADANITVNAVHPATYMPTKIVETPISTLEQGLAATLRLILDPGQTTGRYYNGSQDAPAQAQAYDTEARDRLRKLSEQLTAAT